jgi:hypothetical protein
MLYTELLASLTIDPLNVTDEPFRKILPRLVSDPFLP